MSHKEVGTKRKKVVLTLETKLALIEQRENGAAVGELAKTYNIGTQTVRDIVHRKEKLLEFVSSSDALNATTSRKSLKGATLQQLDTAVYTWFKKKRAEGCLVSGPLLCEKALYFYQKLKIQTPFNASRGWLQKFKLRHGIRLSDVQGETLSGDLDAQKSFCKEFCRIVGGHSLTGEQIYNADETGLFWKALPRKAVDHIEKSSQERISLMLCSNASGSHKLRLVCIGKPKNSRFIGNMRSFPVIYYNQSQSCMTQVIFKEWFFKEFVPSVRQHLRSKNLPQRAVLFLDDAASHPSAATLKTTDGQIFIAYLPPQITSLLQPMEQGVLEAFKRRYRRAFLRSVLEEDGQLKRFYKKWSIKEAMFAAAEAWDDISARTLQKSWRKLYLNDVKNDANEKESPAGEANVSFVKLVESIEGFENITKKDVKDWLVCDQHEQGHEVKDKESIIQEASGVGLSRGDGSDEDESECSGVTPVDTITTEQALVCTETLLSFLEQADDSSFNDILNVRKIRAQIKTKMCKKTKKLLLRNFSD